MGNRKQFYLLPLNASSGWVYWTSSVVANCTQIWNIVFFKEPFAKTAFSSSEGNWYLRKLWGSVSGYWFREHLSSVLVASQNREIKKQKLHSLMLRRLLIHGVLWPKRQRKERCDTGVYLRCLRKLFNSVACSRFSQLRKRTLSNYWCRITSESRKQTSSWALMYVELAVTGNRWRTKCLKTNDILWGLSLTFTRIFAGSFFKCI